MTLAIPVGRRPDHSGSSGARRARHRKVKGRSARRRGPEKSMLRADDYDRRSACQVPEQSPPDHEPPPESAPSCPKPLARLSPRLTVTVTLPLGPTRPETSNDAPPA